jgi:transmembrane 9 superfamily member 2/4
MSVVHMLPLTIFTQDDYYNPKFHFCVPPSGPKAEPESLGSILFGDRIFNSPYNVCLYHTHILWLPNIVLAQINMLQKNGTCQTLCVVPDVDVEDARFINDRIREDYALNWLVDGLPAAEMKQDLKTGDIFFDMGFNLGNDEGEFEDKPALHNHYEIVFRCDNVIS